MGFKTPTYRLKWGEQSRWSGLEVSLRGMTIGELETVAMMQSADDGLAKMGDAIDILGRALISWNVENAWGEPIPVSEFRDQDSSMLLAILNQWAEAVGDVPTPLPNPSSDGAKSEEGLITMETLSVSPP